MSRGMATWSRQVVERRRRRSRRAQRYPADLEAGAVVRVRGVGDVGEPGGGASNRAHQVERRNAPFAKDGVTTA